MILVCADNMNWCCLKLFVCRKWYSLLYLIIHVWIVNTHPYAFLWTNHKFLAFLLTCVYNKVNGTQSFQNCKYKKKKKTIKRTFLNKRQKPNCVRFLCLFLVVHIHSSLWGRVLCSHFLFQEMWTSKRLSLWSQVLKHLGVKGSAEHL